MGEYSEAIVLSVMVLGGAYVAKLVITAVVHIIAHRRERDLPERDAALERRLERIETAVDAIAIEVERAGELQRFTARLQHDSPAAARATLVRPITPL